MFRLTFLKFLPAPINHLGQHFPPAVASVLQKASEKNSFSSNVWVTRSVLDAYAQPAADDTKPTVVEISHRPITFYNAQQVDFYIPKGIGFVYHGDKAKEMVLAAKLHGFQSPHWITAKGASQKGLNAKPENAPIMIGNVPFYNGDQIEGGCEALATADARVRAFPGIPFRSLTGKRYGREMCADLTEFLMNNKILRPGHVWGTAKGYQKHSVFVNEGSVPFQIVADDGAVYELFNSVQTTEPELIEQLASSHTVA